MDQQTSEQQQAEAEISLKELRKHNTLDSLWLVVCGDVYDLTKFYHPGGKKKLLVNAGKDATEDFLKQHSNPKYMDHFKDFKVGKIVLKEGEKL